MVHKIILKAKNKVSFQCTCLLLPTVVFIFNSAYFSKFILTARWGWRFTAQSREVGSRIMSEPSSNCSDHVIKRSVSIGCLKYLLQVVTAGCVDVGVEQRAQMIRLLVEVVQKPGFGQFVRKKKLSCLKSR